VFAAAPPQTHRHAAQHTHTGKDAKATAAKAAAAVKKNSWAKTRKPRHSVVFHRPKTLKRTRDPKYTRKRSVRPAAACSSSLQQQQKGTGWMLCCKRELGY